MLKKAIMTSLMALTVLALGASIAGARSVATPATTTTTTEAK